MKPYSRVYVAASALVRAASLLVPGESRRDWVREWEGELWYRVHHNGSDSAARVLWAAAGSFRHALWVLWGTWRWETMMQDLRIATRSLMRSPAFTVVAVLTIALGIGATTSIFTIVDGVLLSPLPYPGGDRLVRVIAIHEDSGHDDLPVAHSTVEQLRLRSHALEDVEGYATADADLLGNGEPTRVRIGRVTPGLLPMLGIVMAPGRGFLDEEGRTETPVAVLSHGLWRDRYGSDPTIVGRSVRLDGQAHQVVGVLPQDFNFLPDVVLMVPLALTPDYTQATWDGLEAIGRRAPGVTLEDAAVEVEQIAAVLQSEFPDSHRPFVATLRDYRTTLVGQVRGNLLMLLAAVGVVLLIACVNVANLFMARGQLRERELAVRASLGAGRTRLVRLVFTEGMIVALAGGALGIVLAAWSLDALLELLPTGIPRGGEVGLDWRVLVAGLITTAGTSLFFGLGPALRGSRPQLSDVLAEGGRAAGHWRTRRTGQILLVVEVAQAMVLLVVGGLLVNTLIQMGRADPGFDPERLLAVQLTLPAERYQSAEERSVFAGALLSRLEILPGIEGAGLSTGTPFTSHTAMVRLDVEGGITGDGSTGSTVISMEGPPSLMVSYVAASPSYLETLGLPILRGRAPVSADADATAADVFVNETLARGVWGSEDAVGRRIRTGANRPWLTVAGVVGDLKHPGFRAGETAELYVVAGSRADAGLRARGSLNFLLRTRGAPVEVVPDVRQVIASEDPELPIPTAAPVTTLLRGTLSRARFYAFVLGLFGALGVVLAAVGIYGVFSYGVARRSREMGIRMALGARADDVMALVLGDGLRVVGLGMATGLLGAIAASRLLGGLLYGVEPTDPLTYAAVGALLLAAAVAAMWVPARRATKADPVTTLRDA